MKKLLLISATILLSTMLVSCEDDEKNADSGRKAAIEFCECLDNDNSKDYCEDALTDKYSKAEYTSSEFIEAFNEEGKSCGVSITKIYTKNQASITWYHK